MEEDDSIIYGTPSPVFNRKLIKGVGSLSRNSLVPHTKSTGSGCIDGSTNSVRPRNSSLFTDNSSPQKSMSCVSPKQISAQTKQLPLPSHANFAKERAKAIERKKLQDRTSPFKLPKHARSDFVKSSALLRSKEIDETERNEFQSCNEKKKQEHKRKSGCLEEDGGDGKKVKVNQARIIGWPSSSESSSSDDDDVDDRRFRIKRLKKSSNFKTSKIPHNYFNKLTACNHDKGKHCSKTKHLSGKEIKIKGCQHASKNQHVYRISNIDSQIHGKDEPYQSHSDIQGLSISQKEQTHPCGASPTFKLNFSSPVYSTNQLSPRRMKTDLLPCAANKSPSLLRLPLPKCRNASTEKAAWKSQSHVTPEKANRGDAVSEARVTPGKTVEKALFSDKPMVRNESPVLIDLTSPASDKAVQQIQQLENDEEVARRLQEELDKEFAMALAQQQEGISVGRSVSSPVDVSLEQPVGPPAQPHLQWITPPWPSSRHQTRAPRFSGYEDEENEIQQMLQHLHSELGVVLQESSPVPRRRRGRGRGFARVNVMMRPDRAGNDYEELLRLGEMLGDAKEKGLSKLDMNRLPTVSYKKTNSGDPESECHICMCDYEEGDAQKILPCFHSYHSKCIDKWIANNATCPVCRVEIKL